LGQTETQVSGELMKRGRKTLQWRKKSLGRWVQQLTCCYMVLFFAVKLLAQEPEVDHVALAQILVRDGHYDRAERTLKKVTTVEQSEHAALLASLWGMVELHKKNYSKALQQFAASRKKGLKNPEIHLYQAEAYLQLGQLQEASANLQKISDSMKAQLPYFLIKAEILWKQQQKVAAWRLLQAAEDRGLPRSVLQKKRFAYLLNEQLYLAAQDIATQVVTDTQRLQDGLAMASQFRVAGQHSMALHLLQTLLMWQPDHEMVALEIAQNYLALGENFSAALVLEQAAKHNNSLSFEASEMLRQVGKAYRARFLNMTTIDPGKRLKQQLALYLEDDDYLSLKYMIPQLQKNKLLENQEIRYAVAYSLFRTGDFEKSESLLNSIDQDGLFEKSIELKREIVACKQEKWACGETI
jgi:Flp pilus assembly protein TadD